ncbi:hypothetical protein BZA70DRAFT_21835 [Myxozyma melibiosi]|uniref:Uncharacterized protein n=1 Tax=Myxozyma melibiosi TaxID=54550 RepID=A0ABR1FCV7_9ASCO
MSLAPLPRRALADISSNIASSPSKSPTKRVIVRADEVTVADEEDSADVSALKSSPQRETVVATTRASPAAVVKPNCLQHANRLRLRLRLAYYKVKHHQISTPLSDLCVLEAAPQITSMRTLSADSGSVGQSCVQKYYNYKAWNHASSSSGSHNNKNNNSRRASSHNINKSRSHASASGDAYSNFRTSSYTSQASLHSHVSDSVNHPSLPTFGSASRSYSYSAPPPPPLARPPPISAATAKLQSYPAVLSESAKKLAAQGDFRPHLPRKRASGTFIHYDATDDKRAGRGKKRMAKRKASEPTISFSRDTMKRTRASTVGDATNARPPTAGTFKSTSLIVTPAKKRYSLPVSGAVGKLAEAASLAAAASVNATTTSHGQFSSPLKSNIPSSSIKGTPGQLGAARSLLDLGLF